MANPKISVIIPVYNTGKYLKKCLESIIYQTYENLEIICIDDGSTDESVNILTEYAQQDDRFIVIEQENSGQSHARNVGISVATGEYISFIDSDDWVSLSLYQKFVNAYNSVNADLDIYTFNAISYFENRDINKIKNDQVFNIKLWRREPEKKLYSVEDCSNPFDGNMSAWNKIYRKAYLDELNLRFAENLIFEDKLFHFETFLRSDKIYLNNDPLYYYRQHMNSTMHTIKNNVFDIFKIMPRIKSALIDSKTYEKNKYALFQFLYNHYLYLLFVSVPSDRLKLFELSKKNLREFEQDNLNPKIYNHLVGIKTYYDFMNLPLDEFMKEHTKK